MNDRQQLGMFGILIAIGIIVVGCSSGADDTATTTTAVQLPTTTALASSTTTLPAETTTTAALSTTTTMAATSTTTMPPTTTTEAPIVFPTWRIPTHGGESAVVYVAYAPFGSEDATELMQQGHADLAEIGQDIWEGFGSLGCDAGAMAALGLDDGLTVGAYFESPADAHLFADAWLAYFGEPPVGVVDSVTTYCLD